MNKCYHAKGLLLGTLPPNFLNRLSSASSTSIHSGFRKRLILYQFCSNALIVLVVFPYLLGRRIYETKFPTQGFFSVLYLSHHFKFSFDPQNLFFFVTVATLSLTSLLLTAGIQTWRETLTLSTSE